METTLNRLYDRLYGGIKDGIRALTTTGIGTNQETEKDRQVRDEQLREAGRKTYADQVIKIQNAVIKARTDGNSCILLKHGAFLDAVADVVNAKGSGVQDVVIYGSYVKISIALYPRYRPS